MIPNLYARYRGPSLPQWPRRVAAGPRFPVATGFGSQPQGPQLPQGAPPYSSGPSLPTMPTAAPQGFARPPTAGPLPALAPASTPSAATPMRAPRAEAAPTAAPSVPDEYVRAAARLAGAKVRASQIQSYLKVMPHLGVERAAMTVAVDNIWADKARSYGVLTGERLHDDLIWNQHWRVNQGFQEPDPLISRYPQALREMVERATQIVKEQHQARERERAQAGAVGPALPNAPRTNGVGPALPTQSY